MIHIECYFFTPYGVPEGTPRVDPPGKHSSGMRAFPEFPAILLAIAPLRRRVSRFLSFAWSFIDSYDAGQ
jgi:hypothetical protein